jgi:putative transcriptional regulator
VKNNLKALREAEGWTQGALADRLGVSRQTVNALETGKYDPALPLAFRIARLFSRPIEGIFTPPDAESRDAESPDAEVPDAEAPGIGSPTT